MQDCTPDHVYHRIAQCRRYGGTLAHTVNARRRQCGVQRTHRHLHPHSEGPLRFRPCQPVAAGALSHLLGRQRDLALLVHGEPHSAAELPREVFLVCVHRRRLPLPQLPQLLLAQLPEVATQALRRVLNSFQRHCSPRDNGASQQGGQAALRCQAMWTC